MKFTYWLNNLALDGNTTSTAHLGRRIRKVIFMCGEIKDLVSDSDKHCAYLEDPNDVDLNEEFNGINEDEVDNLKCECAPHLFILFMLVDT